MTKRALKFIFRLTNVCDKKCESCCNRDEQYGVKKLDFYVFKSRLNEIEKYVRDKDEQVEILFTGGEPFFYVFRHDNKVFDVESIVKAVVEIIPQAKIKFRTSGWVPNQKLDSLVKTLFKIADDRLTILLGISPFQKNAIDMRERFGHMMDLLHGYQDQVIINTIYNKVNLEQTMDDINQVLSERGFSYKGIKENQCVSPQVPCVYKSSKENSDKEVIFCISPAYNALQQCDDNNYYDEITQVGICQHMKFGLNQIFYDIDLSAYHCNDPFVDFNVSPLSDDTFTSVSDQFAYFADRLQQLKNEFDEKKLVFTNRQERCAYCTKYMLAKSSCLNAAV